MKDFLLELWTFMRVRKKFWLLPIIFVTAHGVRYSDVELMLFGADKVIPKPVKFEVLSLALTTLQLSQALKRR